MTDCLQAIKIPQVIVESIMVHALTTELEEVMGLVLGTINDGVATVTSIHIVPRKDKRKDRVEVGPEQLVQATQIAEQLNCRVIGYDVSVQVFVLKTFLFHSKPF